MTPSLPLPPEVRNQPKFPLRRNRLSALAAVVGGTAVVAFYSPVAEAATLLSSISGLPTQTATATGGGSFSATPSPRGASIPVPVGETSMSGAFAQQSAPAQEAQPSQRPSAQGSPSNAGNTGSESAKANNGGGGVRARGEGTHATPEGGKAGAGAAPAPTGQKTAAGAPTSGQAAPAGAIATTASVWNADLGFGWYNKYYFRGVDILKEVSPNSEKGGIVTAKLTLAYSTAKDAFSVGVGTVEALERQLPDGNARNVNPNKGATKTNENFAVSPLSRYQEYDLYLAYTHTLIEKKLAGTIGFNHYQFGDGEFYGKGGNPIGFADEFTFRLDYLALPYIHPSLSFAKDIDAFHGEYLEARIDGGFDLYKKGKLSIRLEPYVDVSYDFSYNGENAGWNAVEMGLGMPIRLNDHLTLTLTANYTESLELSNSQPRTNNGFWGGAVFNIAWGGSGFPWSNPPAPTERDAKGMVIVPPPPEPWEFSAGVAWEQWDYTFNNHVPDPFNLGRIYKPKFQNGQLGLAATGSGRTYSNGAVFSSAPAPVSQFGPASGVSNFAVSNASQVSGSPGDQHVTFTSKTFTYRSLGKGYSLSQSDEDPVASPYVSVSKELWRKDAWSARVGFDYQFSQSEGDSGTNLVRLDTLTERTNTFNYIYAVDAIGTNTAITNNFNSTLLKGGNYAAVVTNAVQYANSYGALVGLTPASIATLSKDQPQTIFDGKNAEVARVATFLQTKTSLSAHEFGIPLSLRRDLGRRWHVEASVAPTLTILNWDTQTDVEERSLTDFANPQLISGPRPVNQQNVVAASAGSLPGTVFGSGANPGHGTTSLNSSPVVVTTPAVLGTSSTSTAAANFGGKAGQNPEAPKLPGTKVGSQHYDASSTDVRLGFDCKLTLIWDIDDSGKFFTELWGEYNWMDPFSMGNGGGGSGVRPAAFEAGIGVGMRF